MIEIKRTNSSDKNFQQLVYELDKDLAQKNGTSNAFFAQYNKIDTLNNVVIVFIEERPVGCGAMKEFDPNTMEVKRMFVLPEMRKRQIAGTILQELEMWAKELAFDKCVLETGDKMPEAIGLYKKYNYKIIPNYGQYKNIKSSICFEKYI